MFSLELICSLIGSLDLFWMTSTGSDVSPVTYFLSERSFRDVVSRQKEWRYDTRNYKNKILNNLKSFFTSSSSSPSSWRHGALLTRGQSLLFTTIWRPLCSCSESSFLSSVHWSRRPVCEPVCELEQVHSPPGQNQNPQSWSPISPQWTAVIPEEHKAA